MSRSPWQRALGDRMPELDPGLRAYFSAIPAGSTGRGTGVFDVVGTPRRWLWPVLALVPGLFPVWERSVPFTVVNRSTPQGTVLAERTFHFADGDRTMRDETGITAAGLTDRLGFVDVRLAASVVRGRLVLESTGTVLRLGPLRVPLGILSPRLSLVERTEGDHQHVSLRLWLPVVGTLYEYSGSFRYAVEAG